MEVSETTIKSGWQECRDSDKFQQFVTPLSVIMQFAAPETEKKNGYCKMKYIFVNFGWQESKIII